MLPRDFYQFVEGYNKKLTDQHEISRRIAYFSVAPHLSKNMNMGQFFNEYWPLPSDVNEQNTRAQRLKEKLKRLKENGSRATTDTGIG